MYDTNFKDDLDDITYHHLESTHFGNTNDAE